MMKNAKILFVSFLIFSLLINCANEEVNKEPPPARVLLVEKTPDTSAVENGIDAKYNPNQPDYNSIFIEWHPNKEKTLLGYYVYRSESFDKNYIAVGKITRDYGIIDTTYEDNNVSLHQRYYYFVKAFDEFDQFSEPSDTVNYRLVENPILSSPQSPGYNGDNIPLFVWDFKYIPGSFIFRLIKIEGEILQPLITEEIWLDVEYRTHQEWSLAKISPNTTLPPGNYKWRIDVVGSEDFYGAESDWLYFTVN
jgi:hypothetical protein